MLESLYQLHRIRLNWVKRATSETDILPHALPFPGIIRDARHFLDAIVTLGLTRGNDVVGPEQPSVSIKMS